MRTLLIALLCLNSTLIAAQDLTDADIQQWTKAYTAVVNWAENSNIEDDFGNTQNPSDYSQVFSQMMDQTRASKHYQQIVDILKKNGYSDPQLWSTTGDRIMTAFMANEMDATQVSVDQQMQQMKAMMDSGMIPPEQKAMMEDMINASTKALQAAAKAPAADKAAVKRNRALLDSVFDSEEH